MKNLIKIFIGVGVICLCKTGTLSAQTPTDAIMMTQRESCVALMYDFGRFDQYWEGEVLRYNQTIATVSRTTVMPMIAIGLHNKLNLIVATPYVKTRSSEPNGGRFNGAQGFQDIMVSLKGEVVNKQMGPGKLAILGNIGFSTPMTNYLSDYMPYSLGFGAPEFNLRGIFQYRLDNGVYARVSGSHLWRGMTEAERDYYYNNGSYYTSLMDVPGAWHYQVVTGVWLLQNSLKLEVAYTGLKSTSGDDIRKYNAAQPTNKVMFDQVGGSVQYFAKNLKGLGGLVYYNHVFDGRNAAKASTIGAGITYQFKI